MTPENASRHSVLRGRSRGGQNNLRTQEAARQKPLGTAAGTLKSGKRLCDSPGHGLGGGGGSGRATGPGDRAGGAARAARTAPPAPGPARPRCARLGGCQGSRAAAPGRRGGACSRSRSRSWPRSPELAEASGGGGAAPSGLTPASPNQSGLWAGFPRPPLFLPAASLAAPRPLAGVVSRKRRRWFPAVARRRALRWLPGGGVCFRERGGVTGVGALLAAP